MPCNLLQVQDARIKPRGWYTTPATVNQYNFCIPCLRYSRRHKNVTVAVTQMKILAVNLDLRKRLYASPLQKEVTFNAHYLHKPNLMISCLCETNIKNNLSLRKQQHHGLLWWMQMKIEKQKALSAEMVKTGTELESDLESSTTYFSCFYFSGI